MESHTNTHSQQKNGCVFVDVVGSGCVSEFARLSGSVAVVMIMDGSGDRDDAPRTNDAVTGTRKKSAKHVPSKLSVCVFVGVCVGIR